MGPICKEMVLWRNDLSHSKKSQKCCLSSQLDKEEAILSITHGVKGTPMPPWGEVGEDKQLGRTLSDIEL